MFARDLARFWGQLFALMVVLIKRLDCKRKHNNNNELKNNTSKNYHHCYILSWLTAEIIFSSF
jgi:hypothetical protein